MSSSPTSRLDRHDDGAIEEADTDATLASSIEDGLPGWAPTRKRIEVDGKYLTIINQGNRHLSLSLLFDGKILVSIGEV